MDVCEEWNFICQAQVMEGISQVRCSAAECALRAVFKSWPLCQITAFSVLSPRTGGRCDPDKTGPRRYLGHSSTKCARVYIPARAAG